MPQYKKDSTIAIAAVCAIVFCLFSFLYIYCYQTPTLAYAQHVLSGGVTVYHPLISAVLITISGLIIQWLVYAVTRLREASHALTYLPSMLLLAFITSGFPDGRGGLTTGAWIWFIPLILIGYFCLVRIIQQWLSPNTAPEAFWSSRVLLLNILTMVVMMLFVFNVSNGDAHFHRQIRAEKLLLANKYKELAREGQGRSILTQLTGNECFMLTGNKVEETTDSTLTLLRFIAMDRMHNIADSAFTQPVVGGLASLMRQRNIHPLLVSRKFLMRRKSFDYRLCALLAERDLDTFAGMLSKRVNVNDSTACDSLPRHFKEALVLYQHLRSKPLTSYSDAVLEADYKDMRQLLNSCATTDERNYMLRQTYKNNYWSYYFTTKKN